MIASNNTRSGLRIHTGARWNPSRDLRLLSALGRAVMLTSRQVQKVGPFGSREAAARRMRKLAALGLVRIFRPKDKTEPHRYGLTEMGRERVLASDNYDPSQIHVAKGIERADLEHLRMLADIRISLGQACDRRHDLQLAEFWGEADLRRLGQRHEARWIPDAFFVLELAEPIGRRLGFWLELDRGTLPAEKLVESKLHHLTLRSVARDPVLGQASWVVLVLALTERRADRIARALEVRRSSVFIGLLPNFLAEPMGGMWRPTHAASGTAAAAIPELLFQRGVPADGTSAGRSTYIYIGS